MAEEAAITWQSLQRHRGLAAASAGGTDRAACALHMFRDEPDRLNRNSACNGASRRQRDPRLVDLQHRAGLK